MHFPRTLLIAAAFVLAASQGAWAASAVAISTQMNKFYWHASELEENAVAGAMRECEAKSGGSCSIFSICGLPGEGAIAFNKTSGKWGAACGGPERDAADAHALETCNLRSQGQGQCEIVERYIDSFPGGAVSRGYFGGQWAEDCEAKNWTEFRFVNAQEFRMLDCQASGCSDRNEVFRPRNGESVFFWPTDNTRLFKRGPGLMQLVRINGVFINRCER
tara:strand:+ start:453 stop:1109 length:657 start_codon:yes stop_codon:yes gene_type:complete